jgi:hypothetical protein
MQFSNGQFFPIQFWSAPQFAGARTLSGKGYASAFLLRMMRAREIVAQWIMPIHRIDNGFRKVEKMRVAIGLLLRETAKRTMTLVVACRGSICASIVVRYNQL